MKNDYYKEIGSDRILKELLTYNIGFESFILFEIEKGEPIIDIVKIYDKFSGITILDPSKKYDYFSSKIAQKRLIKFKSNKELLEEVYQLLGI